MTDNYDYLRLSAGAYCRGNGVIEMSGPGRQQVMSNVMGRPTEYTQAGDVVETIAFGSDGTPIDQCLLVVEEARTLVVSAHTATLLASMRDAANALSVADVTIAVLDGWHAVAVEGPRSWQAVADLPDEEIAGVLLNEWRSVHIDVSGHPAVFARTGTTAEYGYLVAARAEEETLLNWIAAKAETVGGGTCSDDALFRARVEANHPVEGQFAGLTVREAGAGWMAGVERDDDHRGRAAVAGVPVRRLVATTSESDLTVGQEVLVGNTVVGHVHLVAPRVGLPVSLALTLLDVPFDVPGLVLTCDSGALTTVARPAVDPVSWTESIE